MINIPPKVWTVLTQWGHVVVGAVTAEYILHHNTSLKSLSAAGIAALVPLIYRWANPADTFPHPSVALVAADTAVKTTVEGSV